MTPYRVPPPSTPAPSAEDRGDDRLVASVAIAVGAIPVAVAILGSHGFHGEATLGLIVVVLGLFGVSGARRPAATFRRRWRALRATSRRRARPS
jgi:hypothetical protein